jgi:hypothetical protein
VARWGDQTEVLFGRVVAVPLGMGIGVIVWVFAINKMSSPVI